MDQVNGPNLLVLQSIQTSSALQIRIYQSDTLFKEKTPCNARSLLTVHLSHQTVKGITQTAFLSPGNKIPNKLLPDFYYSIQQT
jgi:hypothetical protein